MNEGEGLMFVAPTAEQVVPMSTPLLLDEPVPVNGRLKVRIAPVFLACLNPNCKYG